MSIAGVSKLRIGLVGPLPPPAGGMANQTQQLAELLRADGAVVELIQVNAPYPHAWLGKIKGVRALSRLLPYLVRLWRSAAQVDLYHVMANSGWSWHLFAAPAIWIGRMRGKPVVVNYRGGEAETFFRAAFSYVKPSLRQADAIIVPSAFLHGVFTQRAFSPSIVPNIINLDRFSPARRDAGRADMRSPCIVVARNLEPIYDNATAVQAFQIVRRSFSSAQLIIAGSGPERSALERLAADLGLADAVTFTGRLDNRDMAALYARADLMVNPSLADNMPISILEALASGVPVVSTNVGGIPHLVEHERSAVLVPAENPSAMADAMLSVLRDPAKAQRLRTAGLELAQRYTWPQVRMRLFGVYQDVLEKRRAAASGVYS